MDIIKYMPYRLQKIIMRMEKAPNKREDVLETCAIADKVAIHAYYRAKETIDSLTAA